MRSFLLIVAVLFTIVLPAQASGPVACDPPEGASALRRGSVLKFLLLGEYHGTSEMPYIAGEIVCDLARSGKRVAVAFEIPDSQNDAVAGYVAGARDLNGLFWGSKFWAMSPSDGRNSQAMVRLLTRLRELRTAGFPVSAAAIDYSKATKWSAAESIRRFSPAPDIDVARSRRDLAMADRLLELEATKQFDIIVVYLGSAHADLYARRKPFFSPDTGKINRHMAIGAGALLPVSRTISLKFVHSGGTAFANRGPGGQGFDAIPADTNIGDDRRIVLRDAPSFDEPYHGYVSTGPISASPPVLAPR
jgi:hypothetical protein